MLHRFKPFILVIFFLGTGEVFSSRVRPLILIQALEDYKNDQSVRWVEKDDPYTPLPSDHKIKPTLNNILTLTQGSLDKINVKTADEAYMAWVSPRS